MEYHNDYKGLIESIKNEGLLNPKVKSGDISLYAAAKKISDSNKDDDFQQDNDEYTEKDFLVDEIDHLASIVQEQMEIMNGLVKTLQLKALQLRRKHLME